MAFRFGDNSLNPETFELTRDGEIIALQPKVFDVLHYLVRHAARVVSKRELLDELWPGEHVNESAVPWSVSHARRAIGQQRGQKGPLETVHGRGYRFTAAVEEFDPPARDSQPPPSVATSPSSTASPRPASPSSTASPRPASPSSTASPRPASPPIPAPAVALAPAAPASDGTPLVGRDSVMERLGARLEQARGGRGQVVLLFGEAGIGKTRSAAELSRRAREAGMAVWTGRCVDMLGAPVFWPFIQLIRELAEARPALADRACDLLTRISAEGEVSDAEDDARAGRFWLLDGLRQLLLDAARESPVMLVLDDLHWADAATLDLVAFIAPELQCAPVLLVCTLRDELEARHEERLQRIGRHAEQVQLSRLDSGAIGQYVEASSAWRPPPEMLQALVRATAGNPLFMQELLRSLTAEHGESGLDALSPTDVQPPEVARDVLRMRLSALELRDNELLSIASVLGESFDLSVLEAVSEQAPEALLATLDRCTRAGLVTAEAPHRYRLPHALVRDVLYADLPSARKVSLHRRAAGALEALSASEPRLGEIAYHYHRSLAAGDYARVAVQARRAAEAAARVYAYDDAITYYEWALDAQALDPEAGPRDRAELLLACGATQRWAGRVRAARATLSRVVESARQHGYGDLLFRAGRVLRPTQAMGAVPDPLLREAFEEVLRIVPEGPSRERIGALSQLACLPPNSQDMQRSKELSAHAVELAQKLGDRRVLLEAMRTRLFSLSGPDDVAELLAQCDELLDAEGGRPTWMTAEALGARFGALVLSGRTAEADQALDQVGRVAAELRWPEMIWVHDRLATQCVLQRGEFAEAEARYDELAERSKDIGVSYGVPFMRLAHRDVALERHGERATASVLDQRGSGRRADLWASTRAFTVRMQAELGRGEEVRRALDELVARDFATVPRDLTYLYTLANLAEAVALVGDTEHAAKLYPMLRSYSGFNTPSALLLCMGVVDHYLALLAVCLDRPEDAERHFTDAAKHEERMGFRPRLARTRASHARWLEHQGGDARRVRELASAAAEEAGALGMGWLERRARRLL